MYTIGYDIGSSSIKAALLDTSSGKAVAMSGYPKTEMAMIAKQAGWAEQDPEVWWDAVKNVTHEIISKSGVNKDDVKAIGISYQMHGLVLVDRNQKVLRPSIIWCDSRAVEIGNKAFDEIGNETCLKKLLNSPGNFTASKLKWVRENEPEIYKNIFKFMLPGDFIAMKLSGEINTTTTGLSEGILWDFTKDSVADFLLDYYKIDKNLVAGVVPIFGEQSKVCQAAADELGLKAGTKVTYRAGDQPNNALSLNVLNTGEIASTAGTSGVVYGVSDKIKYDPQSRVNTFVHVNHDAKNKRYGILLCLNGTGISYSWVKRIAGNSSLSYDDLNNLASKAPVGSDGLGFLNFGNGAERVLANKNPGASFHNLNFNIHSKEHLIRSVIEGVAFSFKYGIEILEEMGIKLSVINAGNANMFLSPVFREALASLTGVEINLLNTDGSVGAARGAAVGAGIYKSFNEAFVGLDKVQTIEPNKENKNKYLSAYNNWRKELNYQLNKTE